MRQYEIRKRLDELYKIELVQKVRSDRAHSNNEELIALLSPRGKKGKRRKARSAAVTNVERQNTRLPNIHYDERTKPLSYEVCGLNFKFVISPKHLYVCVFNFIRKDTFIMYIGKRRVFKALKTKFQFEE